MIKKTKKKTKLKSSLRSVFKPVVARMCFCSGCIPFPLVTFWDVSPLWLEPPVFNSAVTTRFGTTQTCLYVRIPEQNHTIRWHEHRSGKSVCATLKVPRKTVAVVILMSWMSNQTEQSEEKVFSQRRDQEPNVDEFQGSCVQIGELSWAALSCMGEQTDICRQWTRDKRLSSTNNPNGVLKKHLHDSQTVRNKILWSDECKIELLSFISSNISSDTWR